MLSRYLKVFKKNILLAIIVIALIVISAVTKGKTQKTTTVLAGIGMIYAAITFILWLIKAPVKKDKDEAI